MNRQGFRSSLLTGAILFGASVALAVWTVPAMAQSPNCAKPASAADRTVCGSPDLRAAAEDIAALLRDTLSNTPTAERDTVQKAQQGFLAERDRTCPAKSAMEACRKLHETRVADLQAQNSAAQKRLAAVVAGIPKDAKAAAATLQRYDGAAAKAWLVYLYHSGTVPVADKENTVRQLATAVIERDLPADRELAEELRNLGDVATAPPGTMLLFLRHVLSTTEMEAPCFLFTRHGQPALEAFGAFWGGSRDASPTLCQPPASVFDLPDWKKLSARLDPVLQPALDERGAVRQGYERQFDIDDLQASLVPFTLLEAPQSAEARKLAEQRKRAMAAFRGWRDYSVWPEAEYKAAVALLAPAIAATTKFYREKFGLNAQTADQAARAAADRYIADRLALLLPEE